MAVVSGRNGHMLLNCACLIRNLNIPLTITVTLEHTSVPMFILLPPSMQQHNVPVGPDASRATSHQTFRHRARY